MNASRHSIRPEEQSSLTLRRAYHEEQGLARIEAALEKCYVWLLKLKLFGTRLAPEDSDARGAVIADLVL